MKFVKVCNQIIRYSFYLLFFFTPLILTPWNYELFEFNKMLLVYFLTSIIAGAWLLKMVAEEKIRIQRTPLDIPILLFFIFNFLSLIFSIDRHVSLWGYYSRFHGGLLSTICYIILYYAFVTNFAENSKWEVGSGKSRNQKIPSQLRTSHFPFLTSHLGFRISKLLMVILLSATLVSLYGILEHFGIDKNLWVQDVQNRVFSTLGQPNWLAAYLCVVLPIAMTLAIRNDTRQQGYKATRIQGNKDTREQGYKVFYFERQREKRAKRVYFYFVTLLLCYLVTFTSLSLSSLYQIPLRLFSFLGNQRILLATYFFKVNEEKIFT